MRAVILNDTSRFHHGSAAVVRVLRRELERAGLEVTETVYGNTWLFARELPRLTPEMLEDVDVLIINGEGTMHDDAILARYFLQESCRLAGKRKVFLLNSLWQNMSDQYRQLVENMDLVIVREPRSFEHLGISHAKTLPDLSCFDRPPLARVGDQGRVCGTFYRSEHRELQLDAKVDITSESWETIVNKLRHATSCVTGKHHEVMACIVARCPFVFVDSPTWKISGLGDYIGQDLLQVEPDATRDDVNRVLDTAERDGMGLYQRLFDCIEGMTGTRMVSDMISDAMAQ